MSKSGISYKQNEITGHYDAIMIGSGIGSLAAAALLARYQNKKVLVLERHYVSGGFTHTFKRPGFDWDVGVHYIGEVMDPSSDVRAVFDAITDGQVQWAPMSGPGEAYDQIILGDTAYDFVTGTENWRARLHNYFPEEKAAIDGYLAAIKDSQKSGELFFANKVLPRPLAKLLAPLMRRKFHGYSDRTTQEVVESFTSNKKLQAVLTGQFGDYGLPPAKSSFAIQAMVTNHYLEGGAYPVGGSEVIPQAIKSVIEKAGGAVYINAEVDQILVSDNRATGVRMTDGKEVHAPIVVSDAGYLNTWGKLLRDHPDSGKMLDKVAHIGRSVGHLCLYLGLDGTAADLELPTHNLWIFPDEKHNENFVAFENNPEEQIPVAYVSFASAKDPEFENRNPGHSTIDIITLAKPEWFAQWEGTRWKKRGEDYEAAKASWIERILEPVYTKLPQIRGKIKIQELSTPLTTAHFCNYDGGEIYGLNHTPERFRVEELRPSTPIKNLYLTGQDVCSAGVAGAMFGGVLCASAIAKRDMLGTAKKRR